MNHKFCIISAFTLILNVIIICDLAQSANNMPIKPYTIVTSEDLSMKALTKNLSQYSTSELKSLPVNVRKEYRIVVPSDISREELKATMKHLVAQETKKNSDIDTIVIFAYDRKEDSGSVYTFGKMEWCPYGNWGGVTPVIASSNDRSSYKYIFDIAEKVGNISTSNMPTKEEYKIYDALEKALWDDPNADEKIAERKVAKEFGISEEELNKIYLKVMVYKMK